MPHAKINATIIYEILRKQQYFIRVGWKLIVCVSKVGLFRIKFVKYIHSGPKVKNK